jgi:hypothetical protein
VVGQAYDCDDLTIYAIWTQNPDPPVELPATGVELPATGVELPATGSDGLRMQLALLAASLGAMALLLSRSSRRAI